MKKFLALVLSLAMVICTVPATVFAADSAETESPAASAITGVDTIEDQEWTGEEITISADKLIVRSDDKVLKLDEDYTVSYENNINVGTATVVITGKGSYSGTVRAEFRIVKHFTSADRPTIDIPTQIVSTEEPGKSTLENASVTWNNTVLKEGTDYDITGVDNSKAGTQTAKVTFKGLYYGEFDVNYNVVNKDFSKASLYLNDLSAVYTFDGKAKTPSVTIRDGETELQEGVDYTVTYENNVNAGTATIKVIGAGSYAGELTKDFTINKARLSACTIIFDPDAYTATGQPITPTYTVKLGDYTVTADEYTAVYTNNVNIGEATAALTATGKNFTGTLSGKFTIAGKSVADLDCTLSETEYNYDGTEKTPSVVVKDGTVTLTAGKDYTVTYEDNRYAGTAKVIITGMGQYAGTKTVTFTIKGKANTVTTPYTYYYRNPGAAAFTPNVKTTGDGTGFTFTSDNENVATVDATGKISIVGNIGKARITIQTVGTKEYEPASKVITVTVRAKTPVFSLSSPVKKQVKVLVTKVEGATNYEISYGRMGKYYKKTIKHIESEFPKTYTYIKNRTSGKNYFIKVRAITKLDDGTTIYGKWSIVKKIKSK